MASALDKAMAGAWIGMGGVCMLAPTTVLELTLHPRFLAPLKRGGELADLATFIFRCFGAQAVMTGVLLGAARFDRRGYLIFGAAIIPFFAFDAAAYKARYLNGLGALGDLAGNLLFTAGAAIGAGLLPWARAKGA
jgi:hypothetical protein